MGDFSNSEFLFSVVQGIRHAAAQGTNTNSKEQLELKLTSSSSPSPSSSSSSSSSPSPSPSSSIKEPVEKELISSAEREREREREKGPSLLTVETEPSRGHSPRPSRVVPKFFNWATPSKDDEEGDTPLHEDQTDYLDHLKGIEFAPEFSAVDYVQFRRFSFSRAGGTKETVGRRGIGSAPASKVLMKDYCSRVFGNVRQICGVSAADYIDSWDLSKSDCTMEEGAGRSGSLFLFSKDKRFLLKTVPRDEAETLRYILPHYHRHITKHPTNLLMKFYALHRFQAPGQPEVFLIIANNLLFAPSPIHTVWDLKGRKPKPGKIPSTQVKTGEVLKDKDLNRVFRFHPMSRDKLLADLKRDTEFLCQLNLMDYSFLIGTVGKPPPPEDATVHIPLFVDGSAEEITTEVSIRIGPSGDTGTEQKELASEHCCSLCGGDTPFPGVKLHSESKRKAEKEGKENVTDKEKQKEKKKEKKEKKKEKKKEGNGKEKEKEGEKGEKEESGVKRFIQERDLAASAEALPAGNCDSLITDSDQSLYCMTSFDNSEVFYLGLIDFLAQYRFKKKSAHFFKSFLWRGESLSTVPSDYYCKRLNFYLVHVIHPGQMKNIHRSSIGE